jgi:YHS domain-containing protein
MKLKIVLLALLSISMLSCHKNEIKVKHNKSMDSSQKNLENVKVVNTEDPVCHMKIAGILKDTATYENNRYGFCSAYCKGEFKKNPEQYVKK